MTNTRLDLVEAADRYRGSLLGLAVGDALGTTLEFQAPGTFDPIDDIKGGGPFGLKRGEWTDDTSMALCLAESLVQSKGFDALDQMRRYCRWMNEGYMSSNGSCFDIGATVGAALRSFERSGDPISGSTNANSAGNGSLMRLAPVPLFYGLDARAAIEFSAESSRTTHGAQEAVDACRYYAGLIVGALQRLRQRAPTVRGVHTGAWHLGRRPARLKYFRRGQWLFQARRPADA
jgi:ADP-ribosylglycohydrolase